MADIAKITLPSGDEYDLKDSFVRNKTIEYIVGTQTAATNAWTGNSGDSELYDGKVIAYKLPYAGNGSAATLNLTLSNGEKTGAIAVRMNNNTNVTTHFAVNSMVYMTYDGSVWRTQGTYWVNTYPNSIYYYNNTYAKVAITADRLIVGDANGYQNAGSGVTFDITYPLLWSTAAIDAGKSNYANQFCQCYDRNLANVKSGFSSTGKKEIYLVVTISGNIATIDSTIITDTLPTSADGKVYISLGRLGTQSTGSNYFNFQIVHPMWEFVDGAIRPYSGNAQKNVQSNWNETDTSSDAYIQNKPTVPSASSTTPLMDGTATAGTGTTFARGDHVHPVDESRAPIEDPHFLGVPTAETAVSGTWTTQIATTGFVCGEIKHEVHDNAGVANGYATLDSDAKVVASQIAKKIVTVTSSRSLQLSDAGKFLIVNSSGYVDINIPSFNLVSFPTDTEIIVCNYGTGIVTFIVPNTVTMHSADGILQMPKQYCVAHLKNIGINSWVLSYEYQDVSIYAPKASPALTGTPTAPTANAGTNSTQIATTAFVATAVANAKPTAVSVTVLTSDWNSAADYPFATVNVTGVTTSNSVIVAPAPSSRSVAIEAQMYCLRQLSGALMFACKTIPTADVVVNVLIFK